MNIREETERDRQAIKNVNDLAFGGTNEGKLVESIRGTEYFFPELSLCAVTETNILVGHLLLSTVFIDGDDETYQTLALAPMSVLPGWQHKGIGSLLVKEGLLRAKRNGFKHVVVLGHPDYYPKFGFQPAAPKGIYPPFPVSDDVFMVIELQEKALVGIKGTVRYPPSFNIVT
ncbi:GNAT family N-acetyltransferase [Bacillus sp. AK031]